MLPYISTTVGSEDIVKKKYFDVVNEFSDKLQAYASKGQLLRHKIEEVGRTAILEYELVGVGYIVTVKMTIAPNPKDPDNSTQIQSQAHVCRTLGLP